MLLEVKDLICGYTKDKPLTAPLSFGLDGGEILCVLGPNGVGKTTLFKTILGLIPKLSGSVYVGGKNYDQLSPKERARLIAYVPQTHTPPFPFKVIDVVLMGRAPYVGLFSSPSKKDKAVAEHSLELMGISDLKDRCYTELSGGQRQLVILARALAAEPKILIMDEPTASLDFGNQIKVLNFNLELSKRQIALIMTTHQPYETFYSATKTALLGKNKFFKIAPTEEIITEENIRTIYDVQAKIISYRNIKETKTCVAVNE